MLNDRAEQATRDRSLLRLMNVLQKSERSLRCVGGKGLRGVSRSGDKRTAPGAFVAERAASSSREPEVCGLYVTRLASLTACDDRTALLGQYDLILSLLSTLDNGSEAKLLVDSIIDHCELFLVLSTSSSLIIMLQATLSSTSVKASSSTAFGTPLSLSKTKCPVVTTESKPSQHWNGQYSVSSLNYR